MIFFRAHPVGGELKGGDDAADARVFQPEEMPLLPFRTHREMMAQWLAQHSARKAGIAAGATGEFTIRPAEAADANEVVALLHLIPANRALIRDEWRDGLPAFPRKQRHRGLRRRRPARSADHRRLCRPLDCARADRRARLDQ